jgi:hypothetical protein
MFNNFILYLHDVTTEKLFNINDRKIFYSLFEEIIFNKIWNSLRNIIFIHIID